MLKKTSLALLSLTMTGLATAGMYSPPPAPTCVPGDLTVPCERKAWDLGVQALYLQPLYSGDRGYERNLVGNYNNAEANWGWGYRIEGSYHFHMGNDISLSWQHYDNNRTNRSGFAGITRYALTNLPFNLLLDNRFDQVNLVVGQHVDAGIGTGARFYTGLQYAKIRVDSQSQYNVVPALLLSQSVTGISQFHNGDFNGAGPVAGIDYFHDLNYGFSLTANASTSLLYGTARYVEGYLFNPSGLVTFPSGQTQKTVVPSIEAKLGLKYTQELVQGLLKLEGGYQAINYFNAFETRGQVGFGNIATNSNFGLYGPYFGAKWIGNV